MIASLSEPSPQPVAGGSVREGEHRLCPWCGSKPSITHPPRFEVHYRAGCAADRCEVKPFAKGTTIRNAWEAWDSPLASAPPPASGGVREGMTDRFWLIVREPGMVPDRKGPWPHRDMAKVMREFIAARPRAFLDVLTIGADGTPDVQHGPEALQMADGRSMSVGSKHNQRVREAAEEALATHAPGSGEVERFANDGEAKALYDSWSDQPGWVPWVERGNSDMQERARREVLL